MKTKIDVSLILSGIRALIGEVTPCLRSASIEMMGDKIIFKCVFDETATEDDFELMSAVGAEIIADFPDCGFEEVIYKVCAPETTNPLRNVLYQRHESNYWQ